MIRAINKKKNIKKDQSSLEKASIGRRKITCMRRQISMTRTCPSKPSKNQDWQAKKYTSREESNSERDPNSEEE